MDDIIHVCIMIEATQNPPILHRCLSLLPRGTWFQLDNIASFNGLQIRKIQLALREKGLQTKIRRDENSNHWIISYPFSCEFTLWLVFIHLFFILWYFRAIYSDSPTYLYFCSGIKKLNQTFTWKKAEKANSHIYLLHDSLYLRCCLKWDGVFYLPFTVSCRMHCFTYVMTITVHFMVTTVDTFYIISKSTHHST